MKLLFSSLLGQVLMRCLLDLEVRMATCQRCQKGEFNRDGSSSRRIGCQNGILDDSGNFADFQ